MRDKGPFLNALYVREAFGLAVARDIPVMVRPVPFQGHIDTDPGDWDRWWQAMVDAGPEIWFVPPSTGPSLLIAYEQVLRDVGRWSNHQRQPPGTTGSDPLLITRLVAALEQALGRQASFSYFIDVLPIIGDWHLDLSPVWLLVSMDVYFDADRLTPLLEERLTPLV
jgi:hypothetical protein